MCIRDSRKVLWMVWRPAGVVHTQFLWDRLPSLYLLYRPFLDVYKRQYLELAGSPERVDMRSYERQGLDIIPTVHMGVAVCALERKGIETNIGNLNRDIKAANRMMNAIRITIRNLRNWIADIVEATKEAFAEMEAEKKNASPADVYKRQGLLYDTCKHIRYIRDNSFSSYHLSGIVIDSLSLIHI